MIVQRWQAPLLPTEEQTLVFFHNEGLDPQIEEWNKPTHIKDHRHNLTEILVVSQGEIIVNIAGNQVLLRQGDRAEIPSNTKHSYQINQQHGCRLVVAYKI